ncbi:MAG: hypothetical protein JW748_07220 [Anaerolineales bacterium]|nr:hypothetical protein [Anaerolineales bacterium]
MSSDDEALYKGGKIDRMIVPEAELPGLRDPHNPLIGTVSIERKLCTHYLQFNRPVAPFDDPLVRKAFSLSINRELYVEATAENGDLPGTDILPPGMWGYASDSNRASYDPREAKALLNRSGYFDGSQAAPEIRIALPGEAGEYDSSMEFLISSWEKTLGVDVLVEGISWRAYEEKIRNDPPGQFIFGTHCADYPDPENFTCFFFTEPSPGIITAVGIRRWIHYWTPRPSSRIGIGGWAYTVRRTGLFMTMRR